MNIEKYSDRVKGFIQSAQTQALSAGHQQFSPEHILKVLLDDPEGMASNLIERAGGRPRDAKLALDAALQAMPAVSGGNGQLYMSQPLARVFDTAEKAATKAGDSFVTVERLLLALAIEKSAKTSEILAKAGAHRQWRSTPRINELRQGRTADSANAEASLRGAEEIFARPHQGCARRQARSGHRPRRGNPPRHPGAVAPHQEQSGADRRAGRRQDRHRGRAGAAHRQWRRARNRSRTSGCSPSTWAR